MKKLIFNRNVNYFAPPILWMVFIFFLSSLTFSGKEGLPGLDKVVHFIEYFILTLFVYRLIFSGFGYRQFVSGSTAFLFVFIFSITDEFHQSFVPTREVSLFDILSDTIGATASILTVWKLLPKAPKRLFDLAKRSDLI